MVLSSGGRKPAVDVGDDVLRRAERLDLDADAVRVLDLRGDLEDGEGVVAQALDAGLVEAGVVEAGVVEAGLVEAGLVEAGLVEARLARAGPVGRRGGGRRCVPGGAQ